MGLPRPRKWRTVAFRYRLYLENGEDIGEFATAVSAWAIGDEFISGDRNKFRIVNIVACESLGATALHGLFVVTPVDLAPVS